MQGDKNIIKFEGDHNSPRPQFYYDSVSIFFYNVLHPPPISSSTPNKVEKYYDLGDLRVGRGADAVIFKPFLLIFYLLFLCACVCTHTHADIHHDSIMRGVNCPPSTLYHASQAWGQLMLVFLLLYYLFCWGVVAHHWTEWLRTDLFD